MNSESTRSEPPHTKWGTPKWQDAEQYNFVLELTPDLRRWEFLRRQGGYRIVWSLRGPSGSGFGLAHLLDPRLPASVVREEIRFTDWELSGGPIWPVFGLVDDPRIRNLPSEELDDAVALHHGKRLIALAEAGYALFSVDPRKSAKIQAERISKLISAWQKEARDPEGDTGRENTKPSSPLDKLLRVLDAYEQEGIGTKREKHGIRTRVGQQIFQDSKQDVDWHKVLTSKYHQAIAQASPPFGL